MIRVSELSLRFLRPRAFVVCCENVVLMRYVCLALDETVQWFLQNYKNARIGKPQ